MLPFVLLDILPLYRPFFEVFVCQIYANSILMDLAFGGARYIATGRGVATARIPFSVLFSRFAGDSIYLGARAFTMLLFATVSMWQAALLWFYITLFAMCISPFITTLINFLGPTSLLITVITFVGCLVGNNKWHRNSWIGYVRLTRTRITGFKRRTR